MCAHSAGQHSAFTISSSCARCWHERSDCNRDSCIRTRTAVRFVRTTRCELPRLSCYSAEATVSHSMASHGLGREHGLRSTLSEQIRRY